MQMGSTRRPFDRSLSKEPGLKKPRLTEDPAAADRILYGRAGFVERPPVSNSAGGGGPRALRERDYESSDSMRGPYQHQPGLQLHQELVTQYKTALAELTFNSKPIITNLTIIAGESLPAAKAIAAAICSNILEVPSEQKLPSLYLLDSIVKNIGRDYIKYFASRLPEVFCKAYRQVDPSVHPGMRHLFGTWKGVFPPQALQLIEKDLGFTTAPNVSGPSRLDSQAQRPAHSIHVNPKYLEARQRLETSRAGGASSDTSGALANSHDDVEELERTDSINSARSWADPNTKSVQDLVNRPVRDKSSSVAYAEPDYGSNVSGRLGLGSGRVTEQQLKDPGYDMPWIDSSNDMTGMPNQKNGFGRKHGLESYAIHEPSNSDPNPQHKQNISGRNANGMNENWKNSEEEEYMWNEMNSRPTVHSAANSSAKVRWDYQSDFRSHENTHDTGSRDDDEASVDSISTDLGLVASGTQVPSWSQKRHPPEGSMLSETGRSLSTRLTSSQSTVGRTHTQSQIAPANIGAPTFKHSSNNVPLPNVSKAVERQTLGAPSSTRPLVHRRSPSPSFSSPNQSQLLNNFAERNPTAMDPPTDPRRRPGKKFMGYHDQVHEDPMPLPSQDVYQDTTQMLQPQNFRPSSALMPPVQQRKHAPSSHQRNFDVSEFESSTQEQSMLPSENLGSESRSTMGNSSSDQSNPFTVDSPGKYVTSSSFDAIGKNGRPSSSSLKGNLTNPSVHETRPGLSQKKVEQTALPPGLPPSFLAGIGSEQMPGSVNSSNPVSSLLSSLVAKGLITSSNPDALLSATPKITDQPLESVPEIAVITASRPSSVPVTMGKPMVCTTNEPSSSDPIIKSPDGLSRSTAEIKNLIGFEFKPDVVRKFHPEVISGLLSDLPHQCSICGLRLNVQEGLDRHMEWHALKVPENNPSSSISRRWYVNTVDWVSGIGHFDLGSSPDLLADTGEILESSELMVPADERQCACILCGEVFEDFYSQERNEWMFKEAIYLTNPSDERLGPTDDDSILSPIVHANCISEETVHDLGLSCDVEMENHV